MPRPNAAEPVFPGTMVLRYEGLDAGGHSDKKAEKCPDPGSTKANPGKFRRSQTANHCAIHDPHQRPRKLSEDDRVCEQGYFLQAARASALVHRAVVEKFVLGFRLFLCLGSIADGRLEGQAQRNNSEIVTGGLFRPGERIGRGAVAPSIAPRRL